MALIKCKDCGKEYSDDAKACVHCGAKPPYKWTAGRIALGILVIFIVGRCASIQSDRPEAEKQVENKPDPADVARSNKVVAVRAILRAALRDPDSLVITQAWVSENADTVCLAYRAKNGFGGYSNDLLVNHLGISSDKQADWNKRCTGNMLDYMLVLKWNK